MQLPMPVILASASPRRKAILAKIIKDFQVIPADIDEDALTQQSPSKTACDLAEAKARAVFKSNPKAIVIGSDTVVALELNGEPVQLAKPIDAADADRMLRILAGRMHTVYTAVAVLTPNQSLIAYDHADVWFKPYDQEAAIAYIATGSPMDKAGAYGYQDESFHLIERIEGHESTIVGLPIELTRSLLSQIS